MDLLIALPGRSGSELMTLDEAQLKLNDVHKSRGI